MEKNDNSKGSGLPSGNDPQCLSEISGFNWGACALTWIWLLAFGMIDWGLIVMAGSLLIPCGSIVASVYLGMKGNEIAWRYKHFNTVDEYRALLKKWDLYGIIFLAVTTIIASIGCVLLAVYLKSFLQQIMPSM